MGCPDIPKGLIVPRLFSRIEKSKGEQNEPRPLSDFFNEPALVILGEPGMGKSTSFIQAARNEANSECLTIRQFIPPRHTKGLKGKTLYLDGLDEQRAGRATDHDVLDAIIGRLQELDHPKFRLSCRTADWFGELDKSNLLDAVLSKIITVIRMEPLTTTQIQEIVAARGINGKDFLEQARHSGIEEWLTNPQHLNLVLEVISQGQAWPTTRKELFERACLKLIREHNPTHRRAKKGSASDPLILAAGFLCALILRADLEGVALDEANAAEGFPALSHFPESSLPLVEVARTKLFHRPINPECATYYHRTMAEYLAAHFLVHQMANGFPAERVRILLTTDDGRVPSPLRGLHAWVATLCPEDIRALFLQTDPMGLVLFGDPASLSPSHKGDLLDAIAELANENPWFRGDHWESHPLGRLADPNLKNRFEAILANWSQQPDHLLHTLLDIAYSGKLPVISKKALLTFLHENAAPSYFRARAAETFLSHYPESISDLEAVLTSLDEHPIPDDDHELRGVLLKALYQSRLTPEKLGNLLPPQKSRLIGIYHMFLAHDLVASTPDDLLPSLMDVLAQNKHRLDRDYEDHLAWQSLMGNALVRVLEVHGERVATETMYAWLDIGMDEHGSIVLLDSANLQVCHDWLNHHSDIIKRLFLVWIERTDPLELERNFYSFLERVQNLPVPAWFPDWCLELAVAERADQDVSKALFHFAIRYLLLQPPTPPYPLDRVFSFAERHPQLGPIPEFFLYHELRDYEWRNIQNRIQYEEKTKKEKSEQINNLSKRLEGIRNGTDLNALVDLAEIYDGCLHGANHALHPKDRLKEKTNNEISHAAQEGFIKCLITQSLPTAPEIGGLSLENKIYHIGRVVLAAMDLIHEQAEPNLQKIQDPVLSSAIAFQLASPEGREHPVWFQAIVLSRPELVAEACQAFWLPQLRNRKEVINKLYLLATEPWAKVANKIVLPLLEEYPLQNQQNLNYLLLAALKWGDHQKLLELARTILDCRDNHVSVKWKGTVFLLDHAEWQNIAHVLAENKEDAFEFMIFITNIICINNDRNSISICLSITAISELIEFFGRQWNVTDSHIINGGQRTIESKMARCIHAMINDLAGRKSSEAACKLQLLAKNDKLQPWRNPLLLAMSQHRQMMADNNFQPMTWEEVFALLRRGTPATARDLHTVVVDQIRTIAKKLRHSKTDEYKKYWNTDGHHKTTDPKPEDNSRDRILEALQHKLAPMPDIHVEPEGRYADDKRADIKVLFKTWNIPIEIKQDYHPELWNAATNQLIAQYVRDPGTQGYGIYLVPDRKSRFF